MTEAEELVEQRSGELTGLLKRFALLDAHYESDIQRLTAIAEAAEALDSLAPGPCPLCGAEAAAQNHKQVCEADLPALAQAARAEASRIKRLQSDLALTVDRALAEQSALADKLTEISRQSAAAVNARAEAEQAVRGHRSGYANIFEELMAVKDRLRLFDAIRDLERSIANTQKEVADKAPTIPDVTAPRAHLDEFAEEVGAILQAWKVPGTKRVFFDPKENDLQLDGKLRGSQGKGLRALTHAAFIIGLMTYCLRKGHPHPGFVVVDSPLLSYRGDEVEEDPTQDLKKTTVDAAFYRWLATNLPAGQVVVIENRDAPPDTLEGIRIHQFMGTSRKKSDERYGFFPKAFP